MAVAHHGDQCAGIVAEHNRSREDGEMGRIHLTQNFRLTSHNLTSEERHQSGKPVGLSEDLFSDWLWEGLLSPGMGTLATYHHTSRTMLWEHLSGLRD